MQQIRFTEKALAAAPVKDKAYCVRHPNLPGFFVDINRGGTRTFKVQADLWSGQRGHRQHVRTVRVSLGRVGELPVDQAYQQAAELLARIKNGHDPKQVVAAAPRVWTVEQMFAEYAADLRVRDRSERTVADLERCLGYLESWKPLPITNVTKAMARERHSTITRVHGAVSANMALRAFRKCFNFARKAQDASLGENPTVAVTYNKERGGNRSIDVDSLGEWYAKVLRLPNPLRRLMHEFGLYSGLRPGNLVALEKAWVRLEQRAIVIPADRMKGRREFALPLSDHLIGLVQRILDLSAVVEPNSAYLFPTRGYDGKLKHCQVWSERALGSETGHTLRHTFSNCCRLAGIDDVDRELLLAHKIPGVQGVYLHVPSLFSRLLEQQERVSRFLEAKVAP